MTHNTNIELPQARCAHFNECGGCDMQDTPYDSQIAIKKDRLKGLFSGIEIEAHEDVIPSPRIWYYRNKMEYAVGASDGGVVIGLRRKRRFHKIVDIGHCAIFYEKSIDIFSAFKTWIREHNISPYDMFKHTGIMRYIAFRHSKFYDEMMVIVVMAIPLEFVAEKKDILLDLAARLKTFANIRSVYLCINNGVADTAISGTPLLLEGDAYIRERINGIDYMIGPSTFFQTNSFCCAELYNVITGEFEPKGGGKILDLYCGSGGITLQLAGFCGEAIGVDSSGKNIEDAVKNARLNGIKNVVFILGKAEDFLARLKGSDSLKGISAIIVDPPRAGIDKKTRLIITQSKIEKVIYVSCNPRTMADDLKIFASLYSVKTLTPVDMFPHTRHIEAVAVLEKK